MANTPTPAEIITAINALLPVLEGARSRPQMYFSPIEPNVLIHWLHGLLTGYLLFQVSWPNEHREKALRRRKLHSTAFWEDERLLARGLTPEQVVSELLTIEIEMWQGYGDSLQQTTLKNSDKNLNQQRARQTSARSNCELTQSPAKRAAAIKQTAAIQGNFPPGLAQPALRALANAGYTQLDQLRGVSESELLKLHGLGPKAVKILVAALKIAKS